MWNGVTHTFGAVATIGNVGSWGYANPNLAVAPNGMLAVVWSENALLRIWTWPSANAAPSGSPTQLSTGGGIYPVITSDSSNRFHIVWDGDFQIQYARWNAGVVERRDVFSPNSSTRPDIAVDLANGVHLVWFGGGIKYRSRPSGGEWGSITTLDTGGNVPQISADGLGNVHIAWSRDFDIQYARRRLGTGNLETTTIDSGSDLEPTIAATPSGKVLLAFRDSDAGMIRYATKEGGAWSSVRDLMPGVQQDLSARPYHERAIAVTSHDWDIRLVTLNTEARPGTLIPQGATWRYFDTGLAPAGWRQRLFSDASWASGPAQLGFGEGDESTAVNNNSARVTTYFRHTFNVTNLALAPQLKFRLLRDDGAVVYLNGTEIFRSNLPTGAITSATSALDSIGGAEEEEWQESLVVDPPLVSGTNVVAVEVHQSGTTSSDLSFDMELRGVSHDWAQSVSAGAVWTYLDNGTDPGTAWRAPGFVPTGAWKVGAAELGYGDGGESTIVEDNAAAGYNASDTNRYITTYFRRTFLAPNPNAIGAALIRFLRDDGIVVYLNGTELFRDNMPTGNVASATLAASTVGDAGETTWWTRRFDPARLVPGENTIAVEIHQSTPSSSDLSFDAQVLLYPHESLPTPMLTVGATNVTVAWPFWADAWRPRSSTNLSTWTSLGGTPVTNAQGNWQLIILRDFSRSFFRMVFP